MLRFELPLAWQAGASYLMNQRTFALLLTMSDAGGRPMWSQLPEGLPGFQLAGMPIRIVSQMPDVIRLNTDCCGQLDAGLHRRNQAGDHRDHRPLQRWLV